MNKQGTFGQGNALTEKTHQGKGTDRMGRALLDEDVTGSLPGEATSETDLSDEGACHFKEPPVRGTVHAKTLRKNLK